MIAHQVAAAGALADIFGKYHLYFIKAVLIDDRVMLAVIDVSLMHGLADIQRVAQDMIHILLVEQIAAAFLAGAADIVLGAMAGIVQFLEQLRDGWFFDVSFVNMPDQRGFLGDDMQLAVFRAIAQRHGTAHEDALAAAGGEFIADALADHLAFKLREAEQDVQRQPPHRACSIEILRDGNKRHVVLVEGLDDVGKVGQRARNPVDFVHHDDVDLSSADVVQQAFQRRALYIAAGKPAIVIRLGDQFPSFMALGRDIGHACIALGIEAVIFLIQSFLGGFARINRATQSLRRCRGRIKRRSCFTAHDFTFGASPFLNPKKI